MTHELKTPIATISLAAQMLADKKIPDASRDTYGLAGIINDEITRLKLLVKGVLRTAIFEKAKLELKKERNDIHATILKAVESFKLQVSGRGGEISTSLEASDPIVTIANLISSMYSLTCLTTPSSIQSPDRA